jgi:hypothetical protein
MIFQMRLWAAALILAALIIVGFVLSVPHAREVREAGGELGASTTPLVSLHDVYKKGVHTITGSVMAPDACTQVSVEATLSDLSSSTILLALTMPPDEGPCLTIPTPTPFTTSLTAPRDALVEVRVNGLIASSTSS